MIWRHPASEADRISSRASAKCSYIKTDKHILTYFCLLYDEIKWYHVHEYDHEHDEDDGDYEIDNGNTDKDDGVIVNDYKIDDDKDDDIDDVDAW